MPKQRLVLLGGGFVGTWIATRAASAYSDQFDVTLISEETVFTFSPLLINGLAGDLSAENFTLDLPTLASRSGFRFLLGTIDLIDREKRVVHFTQRNNTRIEVAYDFAVLSTGAKANFFDIPGLEQASFTLKRLSDADRLVRHLSETLTRASTAWTDEDKKKILSFLVVGGGPTGVELLGAMKARLRTIALEKGLESLLLLTQITLVESNTLLFYGFPGELSKKSESVLRQGGINIRCGVRVIGVEKDHVVLSDQSTIPYETLIWAAGIKPVVPPIQPALPAGPVTPDAFLRLDERLYGAGDAVAFEQNGVRFPKNAQFALQMAHDVLENIVCAVKGQPQKEPHCTYSAALVTVLNTGFFRLGSFVLQGRWVHPFRKLLYRFRLWQIRTGH